MSQYDKVNAGANDYHRLGEPNGHCADRPFRGRVNRLQRCCEDREVASPENYPQIWVEGDSRQEVQILPPPREFEP